MFNAVVVDKVDGQYQTAIQTLEDSRLPEGDVTVAVRYSTLNYKDGLAITGKGPVVRKFPMVAGIDLVGTVEESQHPEIAVGSDVILNGWGVGEAHWGGLAQRARLKGDWLIPLPAGLTPQQSMAIGTAGYTAMLCVMALQKQGVTPEQGEIAVTGANGGVGTVAIALLAQAGYRVVAITGRPQESEFLYQLGASEVLDRQDWNAPGKPLARERWAGAIDTVGSHTLANLCASMRYRGVVAACGLAQGMDFPASVAPFILRGVTLVGVDSVMAPREERLLAWQRLAQELDLNKLAALSREIGLSEVIATAEQLLAGQVRGRVIVDVNR